VIDPATEDVELRLAGASGNVYDGTAAGGLVATAGGFKFNAPVPGGGTLSVKLRSKDGVFYKLTGNAKGFTAGTIAAPLVTRVRIGNDCFAVAPPCKANVKNTRETCKPLS